MELGEFEALEALREAKERNVPWPIVAGALSKLEARGAVDGLGRPWIKVVAESSQISINQLRHMQRTLETIESLRGLADNPGLEGLLSMPMSHAEIISRMIRINRPAAVEKIEEMMNSNALPTYRHLRDYFYQLRERAEKASPIATGRLASKAFSKLCFNILKKSNASACFDAKDKNKHDVARWPPGFRYANPDYIITTRRPGGALQIDAVDCYLIHGDITDEEMRRRILNVATESSFFDRFWIALPKLAHIESAKSFCEYLDLFNVGILEVDTVSNEIGVRRRPSKPPVPDRRKKLRDAIKTTEFKIKWT